MLQAILKEKRSTRLSKQVKATASILNLVEMWKDEESRQKMIQIAERRKKVIEKEIKVLGVCLGLQIMGTSSEEAPGLPGLGWLEAETIKISNMNLTEQISKIPLMGWNKIIKGDAYADNTNSDHRLKCGFF